MFKKILIFSAAGFFLAMFFSFALSAYAQEPSATQDIGISNQDLGVAEPTLLPSSPFYFIKTASRFIRSTLTFNSVKKAELSLQFANEKLLEARKLAEKNASENSIKKALENYKSEIGKLETRVGNIKEKTPAAEQFLDKFVDNNLKQQKIIDNIAAQKTGLSDEIQQAKDKGLEAFANAPLKMETPEEFSQRLETIIPQQSGSDFKDFKNLEVLKQVEYKVPEEAKAAIQKAEDNTLKRLEEGMANLPEISKEDFGNYVENLSGDKYLHLEILDSLRTISPAAAPKTTQILKEAQDSILNRIEKDIEKPTISSDTSATAEEAKQITKENVQELFTRFKEMLDNFTKTISEKNISLDGNQAINTLYKLAKEYYGKAQEALKEEKIGDAWEQIHAAMNAIKQATLIIEKRFQN